MAHGTHFIYTVRPTDTLYWIATILGSDINQLERLNALYPPFTDPGLIFPGQVLIAPSVFFPDDQVIYIVNWGDTLGSIADRFGTTVEMLLETNPQIIDPDLLAPSQLIRVPAAIYVISPGDTLSRIAETFEVSIQSIITANRGRPFFSPDLLYPGYGLIIPHTA
nr:LysM peptidoglycan-binding domain-containing protein [Caldalkalibacillus uzonensis]